MRAAIYLRVSSAAQAGAGHVSLEVQRETCERYCSARGWSVVATDVDTESGSKITREGYQRVLELARAGAIDAIVIFHSSRFGRDTVEFLQRWKELKTLDVALHSTSEDLSSYVISGIFALLAENEARVLASRVSPAKRHKASQGYWLGHAPFGTVNDKGILRPGPLFDLVRLAFELTADGVPSREVNRRLNAALAPSWLHLTTVRKMLRNPVYVGRVVWDGVDVTARWAPMIDPDLFERAGARMTRRYRERAALSPSYPFWIVGLAHCARCGTRMHPKVHARRWGTQYAYLLCGHQDKATVKRGCRPEHFLIDDVQAYVIAQLERLTTDRDGLEEMLDEISASRAGVDSERQARIDGLVAERRRLEARLQAAKAAHLDAPLTFTIADVKSVEAAVRDNVAAIDRELAEPAPASDVDIDELRCFFSTSAWLDGRDVDPAGFRGFLQRIIERVDVIDRGEYAITWRPVLAAVLAPSN